MSLEVGSIATWDQLWEPMKGKVASFKDVRGRIKILKGYSSRQIQPKGSKLAIITPRIEPGERKNPHRHPHSDSIIVLLEGEGEYLYTERGSDDVKSHPIKPGDIMVALAGEGHGINNIGTVPIKYLCIEGPLPEETMTAANTEFVVPMEPGDMRVVD